MRRFVPILAKAVTAVLVVTVASLGTGVALAKPPTGGMTADEICASLPSSNPSDAQECQALVCDLREDLDVVTFLSRRGDRDKATLLSKLNDAIVKIQQRKAHLDAFIKLSQFEMKVEGLRDGDKAKLSVDDADFLLYGLDRTMNGTLGDGGVDTALACVSDL